MKVRRGLDLLTYGMIWSDDLIRDLYFPAAPPEWDDPELQADIKAATGMDISRKGKGRGKGKGKGKRSKNKHPHLTDLKKQATSRSRLEKKVFDK